MGCSKEFKLNGAGGGGSATILADIGAENKLKRKLIENGFQIHSIKLNLKGVQTGTDESNNKFS